MSEVQKKILVIDARMVRASGIGTYLRNLIEGIAKNDHFKTILLGHKEELLGFGLTVIPFDAPIYSVKEQVQLVWIVPKCDIFWSPHYNIPLLPIRAKKRIVTIHDVNHLVFKQKGIRWIYSRVVCNLAVWRSDHVITVSEFSKNEINQRILVPSKRKIAVISNGVNRNRFEKPISPEHKKVIREKYSLPERYMLFVGNVKKHKNLQLLLEAYMILNIDIDLLIVGRKGSKHNDHFFHELQSKIVKRATKHVNFTGYVSNRDLPGIFQMAELFVYPSKYEGFGIPPLEAMCAKVPCVVSNAASIPEVCGDAALYFDPDDPKELSIVITKALETTTKNHLIKKGKKRIEFYSWQNSLDKHVALFKGL